MYNLSAIRTLFCLNKRFNRLQGRLCYMWFNESDTAIICECNTHDQIQELKELDDDSWRSKLIFLSYPVCLKCRFCSECKQFKDWYCIKGVEPVYCKNFNSLCVKI